LGGPLITLAYNGITAKRISRFFSQGTIYLQSDNAKSEGL